MKRKGKQEFTSRSLSPTFTPALAAGPSADTLEMKIPWTNTRFKVLPVTSSLLKRAQAAGLTSSSPL